MLSIEDVASDILNHLGLVIPSESGHGKTFLTMSFVKHFEKLGIPCYVFSPSNIWLKKFGKIDYISVGSKFYNPIRRRRDNLELYRGYSRDTVQVNLDKKWAFLDNGFLANRLAQNKSTLFNIRYLNSRRIKYFIATALRIQFEQRRDLEQPKPIINILEEAQNPFNSYSMNDDISQVLKTVFTQGRTDANIHYIFITQRLNDTSAQIVERLRPLIGYTIGENSLRKIRSQLPKALKPIPQTLEPRNWLYPSAYDKESIESAILRSPTHRAIGKPNRLSPNMYPKPSPKPQPKQTLREWLAKRKRKPNRLHNLIETLKGIFLYPSYLPKYKATYEKDKDESTELNAIMAETDQQDEEYFY